MNVTSSAGIAAAWSASRASAAKAISLTSENRQTEAKQQTRQDEQREVAEERRSPPPPPGQGQRVDVRA